MKKGQNRPEVAINIFILSCCRQEWKPLARVILTLTCLEPSPVASKRRDRSPRDGVSVKLQVLFWIGARGRRLFRRIDEISF